MFRPVKRTLGQNDGLSPDSDSTNLHYIAISNLEDDYRRVRRWWTKKYRRPEKEFEEHTAEELIIEMLEDFYEKNPKAKQKFLEGEAAREEEWDGTMPESYERMMQERWSKKRVKVDISKWQSDTELSEEEEKRLLDNIGRKLPGSFKVSDQGEEEEEPSLGDGEFDEDFT